MQKTLLITSFHSIISRNILATDTLKILKKEPNLRVVIIVPSYKVDFFEENFGGGNVIIEGIKVHQATKTRLGVILKRTAMLLYDNESARVKREYKYYWDKKRFHYYFSVLVGTLSRSFIVRKIFRGIDSLLSKRDFLNEVFSKYDFDLVFSTDVQNEDDVSVMRAARDRGIKIVGMIRSWDNPSKFALRVFPDKLLVWSRTLKDEVIYFYKYPEEKIIITGSPHYDSYRNGPSMSREEFFAKFGFDLNKPLVLYAPLGDDLIHDNDYDQYLMGILGEYDANILVRTPPDSKVKLVDFKQPENMKIDIPGYIFQERRFGNREVPKADDLRLIDTLYHSDVVITSPTSINLDSILVDKPVIVGDFYPSPRNINAKIFAYRYYHMRKLFATGALKKVDSKEEFLYAITNYIKDPEGESRGREVARSLWFSHADGRSGERVAEALLDELK